MRRFVHQQLPARIVFGAGEFARLVDEADRLDSAGVLLISGASAKARADEAAESLSGRLAARIVEVRQHVPAEDAAAAVALARQAGADGIVSIGGGSAVGLAKAVALELGLPIVAVPTTYSGSELTPIYGITSGGRKRTGRDDRVLPTTVIYDPVLTVPLSAAVTAASAMNALAHCVEALYDTEAGPVVQLLAAEAIGALGRGVPACVADPGDLEGRSEALYGAYLSGAALAVSRMALHHTICHVLGGTYGLPHGSVNAAVLPHVTAFNAPAAPDAMERTAAALGVRDAAAGIFDFAASVGAPTGLAALGMAEADLPEAAALAAASVRWNPRPVTAADVEAILADAYAGHRPAAREP